MVIKNWVSFLKKQKGLFTILMVSQIFSLVCIFFVFGVFQNNLYELSANYDTKSLGASLKGGEASKEQLTNLIKNLVDEYDFPIEYIYIEGYSADKKYIYQDRVQYKDGVFSYSDAVFENIKSSVDGVMAQPQNYENADKVVVIDSNTKGRIGDTITLDGEKYKIIGINGVNGDGELEMPYTAFPAKCQYETFNVGLTLLPTRSQHEQFSEEIQALGGVVDEFFIQNNADKKREYSMIGVSILLALLAAGNMYMIYRYIFRKRRTQLAIFSLCGCSKSAARKMFFMEILLNMSIVLVAGLLIFRVIVYPFMINWFTYFYMIYGASEYFAICTIFLAIVLIMGYLLSHKMSKQTIIQLRREGY